MEFEFDDAKSRSNLAKHGINFSDAQQLWADAERVEIPARTEDEKRSLIDLLQISLPLLLKPRKMRKHQDITIYQRPDDELYNSSNAFI